MLKKHHGVWKLRHLVTHLQLLNLLVLSSRPLKYPPRSLPKNPWTSTTSPSPSSVFLLSHSFKCAKCTDFLISLVTGIFSDLQFTGSWNFTASFRSHKPTIVCSPSLDLSFVATLAFIKRLRLGSAFPEPKQGMTWPDGEVVDNGHYLQQMSAKTQRFNNGQLARRYLCLICHHCSGRASTHPRLLQCRILVTVSLKDSGWRWL